MMLHWNHSDEHDKTQVKENHTKQWLIVALRSEISPERRNFKSVLVLKFSALFTAITWKPCKSLRKVLKVTSEAYQIVTFS